MDCEDSVDDMFEIVSTPSEDVPDSLFELQARKPRSWSRGNQLPPSQQQQQQERRKGKLWRAPYQHILCTCLVRRFVCVLGGGGGYVCVCGGGGVRVRTCAYVRVHAVCSSVSGPVMLRKKNCRQGLE